MYQFFPEAQEPQLQAKVMVFGGNEEFRIGLTEIISGNAAVTNTSNCYIRNINIEEISFYFWIPNMLLIKGQEGQYFRETNIAILCFSAIDLESLNDLGTLCAQVRTHASNTQFILLCTDHEQIGQDNAVSAQEIEAFKEQQKIKYYQGRSFNKEVQRQELKNLLVDIIKTLNVTAVEQPPSRKPLEVKIPDRERSEERTGYCAIQ